MLCDQNSTIMQHNLAYDLKIKSAIDLPELRSCFFEPSEADVIISERAVETIIAPTETGVAWRAKEGQFELYVKDVARFAVSGGNRIDVDYLAPGKEREARIFLFGSAFAALLHQRRYSVMHASSVLTSKGSILFCGLSGDGKSTLAAGFAQRGYSVLADDVTALKYMDDGTFWTPPAFPLSRLCGDVIEALKWPVSSCQPMALEGPKFETFQPTLPEEGAQPYCIVFLKPCVDEQVKFRKLSPIEAVESLVKRTYRYRFAVGMGFRESHYKQTIELAKTVSIFEVSRPIGIKHLNASIERIIEFVEGD
ncbi:hypothetical protein MLD52_19655 [Puniceicoccaceae bacterium K14]|nr:hypothetical protein [Puniceicoccaceae bacterium K14]